MENTRNKSVKIGISLLILIFAVVGFSLAVVGCNSDEEKGEVYNSPEEMPEEKRWAWKWDDATAAKVSYSVEAEGVCTITVSGVADRDIWRTHVAYLYTGKEGASYVYTFEAWTQTDARDLGVLYFENNVDSVYLNQTIQITSTRTTYTIYGDTLQRLEKNNASALRFQCGDKLGTFYIKIISIKEAEEDEEAGVGSETDITGTSKTIKTNNHYGNYGSYEKKRASSYWSFW